MIRRIAFLGILTAFVAAVTHVWAAEAQDWTTITRAQAIKTVIERYEPWQKRAEDIFKHMPPMVLFWDTDQHAWYASSVEIAFEEEIIHGFPDGSLRPGSMLTQTQAVILIARSEAAKRKQYLRDVSDIDILLKAQDYGVRVAEPIIPSRSISFEEFLWMFPEVDYVPPTSSTSSSMRSVSSSSTSVSSQGVTPSVSARSSLMSSRSSSSIAESESEPEPETTFITPDDVPELQYASNQQFAIAMPTLGILDLTITHPSDPYSDEGLISVLDRGVGHLFSYPGGGGKVFVYGHSSNWSWDISGYAKIFRQINRLNIGDYVYVTYENALHVYQVVDKGSIPAGDLGGLADGGDGEELLLYTCWPPDSVSERYIVKAAPVRVIPF